MPKINFDGADDGLGAELAHSHPESYKICISERQLKLQGSAGLKETAYHEMTHLLGQIEHGRKFENIKRELMRKGWRPTRGSGVQFISGDQVNAQNKRIREDPERLAKVNEDSDFIKFIEGRRTGKRDNTGIDKSKKLNEEQEISKGMSKEEIEELRKKIGINEKKDDEKLKQNKFEENYKKLKKQMGEPSKKNSIEEGSKPVKQMSEEEIEESIGKLGINTENKPRTRHYKKPLKSWFPRITSESLKKWFSEDYYNKYTKGYASSTSKSMRGELLIKALLITIAVAVLTLPVLRIISYGIINLTLGIFGSLLLFTNFLITVLLILIYDKLVAKHYLMYQALIGGFLLSLLVSAGVVQSITSNIIINFIAVFLVLLAGFIIGNKLYDAAKYADRLNVLNGGTIFLIIIWLVYLIANINSGSGSSGISALLNNFLTNFNTVTSSSNVQSPPTSQAVLNTCLAEVNSDLQIAEAKLPAGTSVSIVNTTSFYYSNGKSATINYINNWITIWNSGYSNGNGVSCSSYYPTLFTCSDLAALSSELNGTENLSSGSIVGAGVAIKFQFPPEAQSNGFTEVAPALCDPSGIMSSSNNYLKNKNSYN